MQFTDLTGIAILWSIGLLALVQAINARGAIRLSLTAIATIVIFVVAGFFSYMKISGYEAFIAVDPHSRGVFQSSMSSQGELPRSESSGQEAKAIRKEPDGVNSVDRYAASATKIVNEAFSLAAQINETEQIAADASEPVREAAESKALAIRNATAKVNRQAAGLFHARSVSELHRELVRATESLRLSGYSLHAYTTLDNAEERQTQFEQSKEQASIATKALDVYKARLANLAEQKN